MTKLSPCPECGKEPDLDERGEEFRVACGRCDSAEIIVARTASGAINAWNAATGDGTTTQSDKTLRDEFAMAAHIDKPMIATQLEEYGVEDFSYQDFAELEARMRYIFADSMLKERGK